MTRTAESQPSDDLADEARRLALASRAASRDLAVAAPETRDRALALVADGLERRTDEILAANAEDVASAQADGQSAPLVDRLRLDRERIRTMARAVREIAAMPDPLEQSLDRKVRPNGLVVDKVTVPLGVILFIYESRPNVTTDAAALCLKSGNAVILRGGREAAKSNQAVAWVVTEAIAEAELPAAAVQVVERPDRALVSELLKLDEMIDLVIPRGGEGLIRAVAAEARMPILKHDRGVCHVFIDADADAAMARRIVLDGKARRPGVCNATECILVHSEAASRILPGLADDLAGAKVELRGCERTLRIVPSARPATAADWGREYLDLILAIRVVDDLNGALEHIARYGSGHTEAIVTASESQAREFSRRVDASAVLVNASTRFNDGGELGLGAEIGIATGKVHARGPCGLDALLSSQYRVRGTGQVRG
jgi:glutamate-5-semialdehyde dehydrogenase